MAPPAFGKSSLRPQLDLQVSPSLTNSDDEQELAVADLLIAAAEGDVPSAKKFAQKLVQAGIGVDEAVAAVDDPGSKRRGPLHLAAAAGKAEVCALLVDEFHADVDATDVEGATPQIFAVQGVGSTAVVGLLLKHGADADKADNGGIVPLHIVAERGSYELAELLLSKGAEVDPICEKVGAPVHIAAENGNGRILKLFVQHDADCDRFSSLFNTPLAASVCGSSLECMEILIEAGADVNSGSPETPLMIAAGKGSIDCIKCLLKAGADANIPDENGKVPVEIAALKGQEECVEILFPVTTPLAEYADWSIDGIVRHGKIVRLRQAYKIKAEGDAAFKKKDYLLASSRYTQALDMDPADSTLYAKRSLCFQQMNDKEKALADANTFRQMQPDLPESSEEEGAAMKLVEEHCQGIETLMSSLNISSRSEPVKDAYSVTRAAGPGEARRGRAKVAAAAGPPLRRSTRDRKPSLRVSGPEWTK